MTKAAAKQSEDLVARLFDDFTEELRSTGEANFALLEECPPDSRQNLCALMNVAVLAFSALQSRRDASGASRDAAASPGLPATEPV